MDSEGARQYVEQLRQERASAQNDPPKPTGKLDRADGEPRVVPSSPEYVEDQGYQAKARGMLVDSEGQPLWDEVFASGRDGPADDVGAARLRLDQRFSILTHVEAHAAAEMHRRGLDEATLYINRVPCAGRLGCERWLPAMVPPDAE